MRIIAQGTVTVKTLPDLVKGLFFLDIPVGCLYLSDSNLNFVMKIADEWTVMLDTRCSILDEYQEPFSTIKNVKIEFT